MGMSFCLCLLMCSMDVHTQRLAFKTLHVEGSAFLVGVTAEIEPLMLVLPFPPGLLSISFPVQLLLSQFFLPIPLSHPHPIITPSHPVITVTLPLIAHPHILSSLTHHSPYYSFITLTLPLSHQSPAHPLITHSSLSLSLTLITLTLPPLITHPHPLITHSLSSLSPSLLSSLTHTLSSLTLSSLLSSLPLPPHPPTPILHSTLSLQICDIPVTSAGVSQLIQKCPPGAETLVLRVISILVESGAVWACVLQCVCVCVRVCRCVVVWKFICWSEATLANLVVYSAEIPPPDVVLYTKGLYERGGKDVRFLIPVMKGLSKVQCVSAVN